MSPVENVKYFLLQCTTTLTHHYYYCPLHYAMVTHGRVLIKEKALVWRLTNINKQIFKIVLLLKNLKE